MTKYIVSPIKNIVNKVCQFNTAISDDKAPDTTAARTNGTITKRTNNIAIIHMIILKIVFIVFVI